MCAASIDGFAFSRFSTSRDVVLTGEMQTLPLTGMILRVVSVLDWPSFVFREHELGSVEEDCRSTASADLGGVIAWS